MKKKHERILSAGELALILAVFCICLYGAATLQVDRCPDEPGRGLVSTWIYENNALPTGNEPETIMGGWGFSYAARPYLSAMIAAFFMKAASLFSTSGRALVLASRMGSVLSITACCAFCLLLGHTLFRKRGSAAVMAVFVCFLPQVLFLGMYQNNDSLSLAAVSMMMYYLCHGRETHFAVKDCAGLAVAVSFCLLSYYSVYGWILVCLAAFVTAVILDSERQNRLRLLIGRGGLILGICLILAGWFFARNALLHQGDLLGIRTELATRAVMRDEGETLFEYNNQFQRELTFAEFAQYRDWEWFVMSFRSVIGVFAYMDLYLPMPRYGLYYFFFLLALIAGTAVFFRRRPEKKESLFFWTSLLSSVFTIAFSFLHSYYRDYQPQGRYIITLTLFLGYLLACLLDRTEILAESRSPGKKDQLSEAGIVRKSLHPAAAFIAFWILLFVRSWLDTMIYMQ